MLLLLLLLLQWRLPVAVTTRLRATTAEQLPCQSGIVMVGRRRLLVGGRSHQLLSRRRRRRHGEHAAEARRQAGSDLRIYQTRK